MRLRNSTHDIPCNVRFGQKKFKTASENNLNDKKWSYSYTWRRKGEQSEHRRQNKMDYSRKGYSCPPTQPTSPALRPLQCNRKQRAARSTILQNNVIDSSTFYVGAAIVQRERTHTPVAYFHRGRTCLSDLFRLRNHDKWRHTVSVWRFWKASSSQPGMGIIALDKICLVRFSLQFMLFLSFSTSPRRHFPRPTLGPLRIILSAENPSIFL